MAIAKKAGRPRKSAASSSAPKASKKIAGVVYTKRSCSATKTGAQKEAELLRTKGKKARVIQSGKAFCVYGRG